MHQCITLIVDSASSQRDEDRMFIFLKSQSNFAEFAVNFFSLVNFRHAIALKELYFLLWNINYSLL